jgi:hypothetical protein
MKMVNGTMVYPNGMLGWKTENYDDEERDKMNLNGMMMKEKMKNVEKMKMNKMDMK